MGEARAAADRRGEPERRAWAGSRRRRRAPRVPAREEERLARETALLAAPAPGRRPVLPCPGSRSRPRTGRCPRCPQRGLPPPGEVATRGGQRRVAGARAMVRWWGRPCDRGTRLRRCRIPPALCFRFRCGAQARERAADLFQMVRPGFDSLRGWAHRGACWGRGTLATFTARNKRGIREMRGSNSRGSPAAQG